MLIPSLVHACAASRTSVALLAALLPLRPAPTLAQPTPWPRGTIVVSNMRDSSATIVDASTGAVRATVRTGNGPHEVAGSHDGKWAVVTNYGVRGAPGNSLTVIDVARAAVARTIDLGTYQRPHGARFLPGDTLLAVTSEVAQAVLIVDLRRDEVVRTLPTHGRTSHMLAMTASGDRFFTANISDGSVSVIDPRDTSAVRTIKVARATEGIGAAPDGRRVWLGSNADSIVVVVDPSGAAPPDTIRGFGMPYRIGLTPDGRRAVVSDPVRGEIAIVDAGTHRVLHRIVVPSDSLVETAEVPGSPSPEGVAVSDDSRWAFVTLQGRNRVVWVDLARGAIVRSAPTGTWSDGIAFVPAAKR